MKIDTTIVPNLENYRIGGNAKRLERTSCIPAHNWTKISRPSVVRNNEKKKEKKKSIASSSNTSNLLQITTADKFSTTTPSIPLCVLSIVDIRTKNRPQRVPSNRANLWSGDESNGGAVSVNQKMPGVPRSRRGEKFLIKQPEGWCLEYSNGITPVDRATRSISM